MVADAAATVHLEPAAFQRIRALAVSSWWKEEILLSRTSSFQSLKNPVPLTFTPALSYHYAKKEDDRR